jgi:hypothetical protein
MQDILTITPDGTPSTKGSLFPQEVASRTRDEALGVTALIDGRTENDPHQRRGRAISQWIADTGLTKERALLESRQMDDAEWEELMGRYEARAAKHLSMRRWTFQPALTRRRFNVGLIRKRKVGANALFIDLDNAVDHELAGVGGAMPSRLSLDVVQRDIEQSLLRIARNRWHHEKARMNQTRFAKPAKVAPEFRTT